MTRLFFGSLPFPNALTRTSSVTDDDERQGVLRTVDCDHYHAVPISDGSHVLFTDPATGLLCLGSDAPLGGPTKLMRKVCMVPPSEPSASSLLTCYRAGSELRWGVRVVAVYDDGRIVLYNMPADCFERIRYIQSSPDIWDELAGVIGQSDLLMDIFMSEQHETSSANEGDGSALSRQSSQSSASSKGFRSLQIDGTVIYRAESAVDDIQIDCSAGGVKIWVFLRDLGAVRLDIYTPPYFEPSKSYIGKDGLPHSAQESLQSSSEEDTSETKGKHRAAVWGNEENTGEDGNRHVKFAVYE